MDDETPTARELMARQQPPSTARIEWLETWRDDALEVLTRQDAALVTLQGYEARELAAGGLADVVLENHDGSSQLLEGVALDQAQRLVAFLERAAEIADGIVPVITEEGGPADGSW